MISPSLITSGPVQCRWPHRNEPATAKISPASLQYKLQYAHRFVVCNISSLYRLLQVEEVDRLYRRDYKFRADHVFFPVTEVQAPSPFGELLLLLRPVSDFPHTEGGSYLYAPTDPEMGEGDVWE